MYSSTGRQGSAVMIEKCQGELSALVTRDIRLWIPLRVRFLPSILLPSCPSPKTVSVRERAGRCWDGRIFPTVSMGLPIPSRERALERDPLYRTDVRLRGRSMCDNVRRSTTEEVRHASACYGTRVLARCALSAWSTKARCSVGKAQGGVEAHQTPPRQSPAPLQSPIQVVPEALSVPLGDTSVRWRLSQLHSRP